MSSSPANPSAAAQPADRREPADRQAQAPAPTTEWPRPPGLGSVAWLDLHDQARAQAQALRREAMVQAWAEVDRAWAATHRSAGRAARRLAQRLRHHWQGRAEPPLQA
jgi:hypothetical protein